MSLCMSVSVSVLCLQYCDHGLPFESSTPLNQHTLAAIVADVLRDSSFTQQGPVDVLGRGIVVRHLTLLHRLTLTA
jgi:hypothetical protein